MITRASGILATLINQQDGLLGKCVYAKISKARQKEKKAITVTPSTIFRKCKTIYSFPFEMRGFVESVFKIL